MPSKKGEAAGANQAAIVEARPDNAGNADQPQEPDFDAAVTVFSDAANKSDKTDKTNTISNHEFLTALFGENPKDIRPVLVSFADNPQNIPKKSWFGAAWEPNGAPLLSNRNNYFSLATFQPDESGKYRRQKKQFRALHAIMLDDIGTKVERERLILPPSWLLETSPGNYQAGYILDTPILEAAQADRLVKAIIQAGLCDPGAGGPTARLARLPMAVNGKHDPAFPCRLEIWEPNRRYSIDQLTDGLELDLRPARRSGDKTGSHGAETSDAEDEIFIPRPLKNAVIAALKMCGLYKVPLGSGKHDITCPWTAEHTGGIDGGTAYFEPEDAYPISGFKCFHGHCADRRVHHLLQHLNIEAKAARMKPTIRSVAGEIHRIADRAERELSMTGKYFQRGGLIVSICTDPGTQKTGVKTISTPALTAALSGAALWERFDGRAGKWVRIDPPTRLVSVLHDAADYKHLPTLSGVAHQPYLRPDGTLVHNPGYDAATGMFGVFNVAKFHIPENPTRQDAEQALALINGLLEEFSFARETDKAAALTAILTAAIRGSLPLAPMYHIRAPDISSGKTFLCSIIGAFATPQFSVPTTFPQDDEECRKLLLSELLCAPAVIEFDNLTGDLVAHKSLCTALTSEYLTGRILGISKTATVNSRVLFLSSGNNVGPVQDMVRRCITINLDPACEIPASRKYKNPHVLTNLRRKREKFVSAALTIIRAWIVAGRPETESRTVASYDEWSALYRQPLRWLGLPDPTESMFAAMNDDPDREMLGRFLQVWRDCFGNVPKMVRDVVKAADCNDELREVLTDIAGERGNINRRVLGHWIKRNARRIVGGLRFVPAGGSRSAVAWQAESVS